MKRRGLVLATVVDNIDEEGLGAITVESNSGRRYKARYCAPFGGGDNVDGAGFFFIPEVGQQVWLAFEGGDAGKPVYIGQAFSREGGNKNPPIESKLVSAEPLNRVIKTRKGNTLELDDREEDETCKRPTKGVRLRSTLNQGLYIWDNDASRDVEIRTKNNGGMILSRDRSAIYSGTGAGMYITEGENATVEIMDNVRSNKVVINNGSIILSSDDNIKTLTQRTVFETPKGFSVDASAGTMALRAGTQSFVSTQDQSFLAGGNYNISASKISMIGSGLSEITMDIPLQGNIGISTTLGEININNTTAEMNFDQIGNIDLQSNLGGIHIAGTAVPNGATGQKAVLGDNLVDLLNEILGWVQTIASDVIKPHTGNFGSPTVPNPAVITNMTKIIAELNANKILYLSVPNAPTHINSQIVTIDG